MAFITTLAKDICTGIQPSKSFTTTIDTLNNARTELATQSSEGKRLYYYPEA